MAFGVRMQMDWNGPRIQQDFLDSRQRALIEAAVTVEGRAAARAPFDLGNLSNSITFSVSGQPSVFQQVVEQQGGRLLRPGETLSAPEGTAIVGTIVLYAVYQEFGTRFQRPQAFLLPALRESVDDIIEIFRQNGVRVQAVQR